MNDERKPQVSTDDLSQTQYGKTWRLFDESVSQALTGILEAALEDEDSAMTPGILFYIANHTRPIVITGESTIVIGRSNSPDAVPPDVDLTAYHGRELGVSRQHAQLTYQDQQYVLQDMHSSNGTWLNGQKLTAHQLYPLQDGDQLRLGHLTMLIKFSTADRD